MKDLCGIWVHKDDEGYYVLHIVDWAPRDPSAAIQARWSNLSYLAKVWDDPEAAMEFGWGVLHSTLGKDLYTLPSEVLIARATKQIALMKEHRADRPKENDELLKLMRENESLKAELPGKSVADYKQSVEFEWGLRQMGQDTFHLESKKFVEPTFPCFHYPHLGCADGRLGELGQLSSSFTGVLV
ncbi:hypothetical protein B296_00038986 [Ensete ventricosum]|uniref:Uncharacterized protein n=1 Tax=Ensete ventricosum TaxID=4639 RepID=A0A426XD94_ENSVE|nr:hypothetical protein B296_00038986 [Ensete ventricosum]